MLWTGFSLRLSQYFGALSFSSTLTSPSVPAAEKQPHSTLLLVWFSAGDEQSWFPSDMMLRIEVHQTSEYYLSQSEGPLGAFILQILSVFSCVYTEERIESCHTAIKPRSMECCSGVCPSVDFSYLHIWSWSSSRVTIRFLVTTLTKGLLHQLVSLASSRKSPGCFKRLPLRVTETTCFCEPSMKQNFFLNSSPDVWLDAHLFLSSTGSSFDLRAWFLL